MDLKTCNSSTAIEKFSVLMFPMTFLVVLSVLFIGFFSLADEYVRGNPWQAVAIAAGAGLLIGLLVSSRR